MTHGDVVQLYESEIATFSDHQAQWLGGADSQEVYETEIHHSLM